MKYINIGFLFVVTFLVCYKLVYVSIKDQDQDDQDPDGQGRVENDHDAQFASSSSETKTTNNSSILVLYWTRVFDDVVNVTDKPHEWPFFSLGKKCPEKCELSSNKSRLAEASALVIHGRNIDEIPSGKKAIPWILHVNENPRYTSALRSKVIMSRFDFLASYRLDSDFPCPEFLRPNLTPPIPFSKKRGLVVAMYSNCEEIRTLYMFRLMKHVRVDSYGKCLQNMPPFPKGRHKNKTQDIIRHYKFSLVFPNADCDYYMTEKIHNALSAGSVPVWMGTDTIDEVLQWGNLQNSIIKVSDYSTPKKLASFLIWLGENEKEYNRYLEWKYNGFQFPKEYYESPIGQWWHGLSLYCRICQRLAETKGYNLSSGLSVDKCNGRQRRTLEKWIRE